MMIILLVLVAVVVGFIVFCNIYVAMTMTKEEMKFDFVTSQNWFGTIFANCFYSLAWLIKSFTNDEKMILNRAIKSSVSEYDTEWVNVVRNKITGNIDIDFFFKNGTSHSIKEGVCKSFSFSEKDIDNITRKYSIGYNW